LDVFTASQFHASEIYRPAYVLASSVSTVGKRPNWPRILGDQPRCGTRSTAVHKLLDGLQMSPRVFSSWHPAEGSQLV
jgi:hypothetical protein